MLREQDFTTNSRSALLLAEAVKRDSPALFHRLHDQIFRRYFAYGDNIGDREVLRGIAYSCGVTDALIERAWNDDSYSNWLGQYLAAAHELNVRATPTIFIGHERIDGVQPFALIRAAAQNAA